MAGLMKLGLCKSNLVKRKGLIKGKGLIKVYNLLFGYYQYLTLNDSDIVDIEGTDYYLDRGTGKINAEIISGTMAGEDLVIDPNPNNDAGLIALWTAYSELNVLLGHSVTYAELAAILTENTIEIISNDSYVSNIIFKKTNVDFLNIINKAPVQVADYFAYYDDYNNPVRVMNSKCLELDGTMNINTGIVMNSAEFRLRLRFVTPSALTANEYILDGRSGGGVGINVYISTTRIVIGVGDYATNTLVADISTYYDIEITYENGVLKFEDKLRNLYGTDEAVVISDIISTNTCRLSSSFYNSSYFKGQLVEVDYESLDGGNSFNYRLTEGIGNKIYDILSGVAATITNIGQDDEWTGSHDYEPNNLTTDCDVYLNDINSKKLFIPKSLNQPSVTGFTYNFNNSFYFPDFQQELVFPNSDSVKRANIIVYGNSINANLSESRLGVAKQLYDLLIADGYYVTFRNAAVTGYNSKHMLDNYDELVLPYIKDRGSVNIMCFSSFTNDYQALYDEVQSYAYFKAIGALNTANGIINIPSTAIANDLAARETFVENCNDLLRSDYTTWCDILSESRDYPELSDPTDLTYYKIDGTHLTEAGTVILTESYYDYIPAIETLVNPLGQCDYQKVIDFDNQHNTSFSTSSKTFLELKTLADGIPSKEDFTLTIKDGVITDMASQPYDSEGNLKSHLQ